ncbi:uncharacterized protein LOC132624283 [Lycium barbarum]|uniref:uncharacterized protein LOC132624283 n=1 Tax=Lycium barbarum TaxID=112863 RepID=UPI00293ECB7A|nr:uncharacterized protein LOC132624283 [Lycium barbarum]
MAPLLPKLISDNQAGFVKGRLITENVLLAQEIIHGMKESNDGGNLVIKLDMSKAYDRLSWEFLYNGDPLSPTLFIIAAEVLSTGLNLLNQNPNFNGFSMSKSGPQINHLCYANELILFSFGERKSVNLLMKVLREYQEASGQEINKDKTNFYTYGIQSRRNIRRLHKWTGYKHAKLPFTYLGCLIDTGRKTCNLFSDLATKVLNKAGGWQGNMLLVGGKTVILEHMLQSQTLYLMAVLVPLMTIMKQIEMYFSNFFWGKKDDKNKYHWSSSEKMSYPYEEGGVGFKRLSDICKAFATKKWWRFRNNDNLWARFLKAKYCPRSNPISKKKNSKVSNAWKTMLNTRAEAEKYIIWRIAEGKVLFWWDTWTAFSPLNQLVNQNLKLGNNKVNEYMVDGAWDQTKLAEVLL